MTRIAQFYIALILLVIIPVNTSGQNWKPFNKDREYYWIQTEDSSTILESIVISETTGNIFNSVLCEFWFPEEMLNYYRYNSVINRDKPAYFFDLGDRILINDYNESENDWYDIDIRYTAAPGEAWTTRGFEMTCDSAYTIEIFGITDSVKSITCTTGPLDTIRFILSKNHGFIQYSPLRNFHDTSLTASRPYFHLTGYRTDTTETGLVQPKFEDYFVQKPGDVLVWRNIVSMGSVDTTYAVDTIRSVEQMGNLLRYETVRGFYDVDWILKDIRDTTLVYDRSFDGIVLESPVSWITDPDSLLIIHSMEPLEVSFDEDTSIVARVHNTATSLEAKSCMFSFWFDLVADYAYESGRGLIHRSSGGLGGSFRTDLIGSVIAGKAVGMTEIPVVSSDIRPQHIELVVYPNPASTQIFIEGLDQFKSYTIYDQSGKLVRRRRSGTIPIDIANLEPGNYVLEVKIEDRTSGLTRFVVLK